MAAALHRVTALVLTLVLALGAPLSTPRSCDRCPVGCPMHREGGAEHTGGCHHGKAAASGDGSVVKCACGHQRVATPAAAEYGLPPRRLSLGPIVSAGLLPEVPVSGRTRAAPEPTADPPRLRVV